MEFYCRLRGGWRDGVTKRWSCFAKGFLFVVFCFQAPKNSITQNKCEINKGGSESTRGLLCKMGDDRRLTALNIKNLMLLIRMKQRTI